MAFSINNKNRTVCDGKYIDTIGERERERAEVLSRGLRNRTATEQSGVVVVVVIIIQFNGYICLNLAFLSCLMLSCVVLRFSNLF